MAQPFAPVPLGGDWRMNAVVDHFHETEATVGFGFVSAADALVEHWQEHGPNDGHLLPIIMNYRHGLELLLKACIREAAACLRVEGQSNDPKLEADKVSDFLARGAMHSLQKLANRLEKYLADLRVEGLPPDTHAVLASLHNLDPYGDTFRYPTTRDKATQTYVASPRPKPTHIDIVEMSRVFSDAADVLGGGVLSVLDEAYSTLSDMQSQYGP